MTQMLTAISNAGWADALFLVGWTIGAMLMILACVWLAVWFSDF